MPQEVHSFDLIASAPGVVACNMSAVPLPDAAVDAAVFSLALMGTDYGAFLEVRKTCVGVGVGVGGGGWVGGCVGVCVPGGACVGNGVSGVGRVCGWVGGVCGVGVWGTLPLRCRAPLQAGVAVDRCVPCLPLLLPLPRIHTRAQEAVRVLKPKGYLWIAEVRSRFAPQGDGDDDDEQAGSGSDDEAGAGGGGGRGRGGAGGGSEDFRPFLACLKQLGLKLLSEDAHNKMFVVWVLQKKPEGEGGRGKAGAKKGGIPWPPLKACMYKKR